MNKVYRISHEEWHRQLKGLSVSKFNIFAPVRKNGGIDYSLLYEESPDEIVYNEAKPFTPLKMFFLPVKLNVTVFKITIGKTIIIGAPACDIEGLKLLDLIYLDEKFCDETYQSRRENTILISSDCYVTQENCHCTTYGLNPYAENGCDISLSKDKEDIYLMTWSEKGEKLIEESILPGLRTEINNLPPSVVKFRNKSTESLSVKNSKLPGTALSGKRIESSGNEVWKKHSSKCVSCGACSAICPTCSCFLLVDKPGFQKVKQLDTCQYPAFERVAGGEDPLKELTVRFKNRYMCKYVWKPQRFDAIACTGCGRCIEACIAKISKNEVIMDIV
ncbi:MAG TPA: 4Fe-4S dicluster domain-containing protein [Bacteroidales bacterium]|nr:4Fe-4S dicluster domain-containing protein [Bacteroidales bacterium]